MQKLNLLLSVLVLSADNICKQLDPDQNQQIGSKVFDTLIVFLIFFSKKMIFSKKITDDKSHACKS